MNYKLLFIAVLLFKISTAQTSLFDSLINVNTHPFSLSNNKLSGKGIDLFIKRTKNVQFVNICEEHSAFELPNLTTELFKVLQDNHDFRYLALEQDPLRMRSLSQKGSSKGNKDSAFALVKRFPSSFTFRSDQDITMIADVARISKANHDPIWGCDPASAISHYLRALLPLAPNERSRKIVSELLNESALHDDSAKGTIHFISQKIDNRRDSLIHSLKELYKAPKGSNAEWLISILQQSVEIFQMYNGNKKYVPYPYGFSHHNMVVREEFMKERFLEEYHQALAKDRKPPKVLSSFGHWHLMRGFGPANQMTLGTFLLDFARYNKMESFTIDIVLADVPNSKLYNELMNNPILKLFLKHMPDQDWAFIDLVPFRYYLNRLIAKKEIAETDRLSFQNFFIRYDALLFIKNGKGTYNWKESSN